MPTATDKVRRPLRVAGNCARYSRRQHAATEGRDGVSIHSLDTLTTRLDVNTCRERLLRVLTFVDEDGPVVPEVIFRLVGESTCARDHDLHYALVEPMLAKNAEGLYRLSHVGDEWLGEFGRPASDWPLAVPTGVHRTADVATRSTRRMEPSRPVRSHRSRDRNREVAGRDRGPSRGARPGLFARCRGAHGCLGRSVGQGSSGKRGRARLHRPRAATTSPSSRPSPSSSPTADPAVRRPSSSGSSTATAR